MHNVSIKAALAAMGLAAVAFSHQASAAIPNAASGNGDLVFVVVDTVTGASYYRDLGKTVSQFAPGTAATFSTDVSTDANYSSLVTEAGSNALAYAVVGGGYSGGVTTGTNTYVSTSGTTSVETSPVSNANLTAFKNIDNQVYGPLNGLPSATSYYVDITSAPLFLASSGGNWGAKANFSDLAATGTTPSNFYYLAGTGNSGKPSTDTLVGAYTFSGGLLSFTAAGGTAPVPLPAAAWLLGSGLLGLVGIGRRRAAAKAA